MSEVVMPRLSDTMEEGTILRWLVRDGEPVRRGQELVEIETDKATMTYESDLDAVIAWVGEAGAHAARETSGAGADEHTITTGEPSAAQQPGAAVPAPRTES